MISVICLIFSLHCDSKKEDANLVAYLCQMLTDFQNPFTGRLANKRVVKRFLTIPAHLKRAIMKLVTICPLVLVLVLLVLLVLIFFFFFFLFFSFFVFFCCSSSFCSFSPYVDGR